MGADKKLDKGKDRYMYVQDKKEKALELYGQDISLIEMVRKLGDLEILITIYL